MWFDDKIEFWVLSNGLIDDKEREFLVQFFTSTTEKIRIESDSQSVADLEILSCEGNIHKYKLLALKI